MHVIVFQEGACIVTSFTLLTVSNALLISNIRRYMVKYFDVIAISASGFIANTCLVVLLPDLYAVWALGILGYFNYYC